jgi:ABC-type glycerol-3-phosphate transport system substrate-binding protein
MTRLRALLFAALIGGLALAACGSTGSGGAGGGLTSAAPATAVPALGTNEPANPKKEYPTSKPSGDPYSDSGY